MVPALVRDTSRLSDTFIGSALQYQGVGAPRFEFRTVLPRDQPGGYAGKDSSTVSCARHIDVVCRAIRLLPIRDTGFRRPFLAGQSPHGHWLLSRPVHVLGVA